MQKHEYDVIIAGAGPTGLFLACELKLRGLRVAILERRPHGTTSESRAPGINARTMEIFRMRGLAEKFEALGHPLRAVLFSGMLMTPKALDPQWPDALILPQHDTERILGEHAGILGVDIYWSATLVHFHQTPHNVDVFVQQEGQMKQYMAKYLAGCDGGSSTVRKICGDRFPGIDPVSHWLVADVQLDNPPAEDERFGRNQRVGTYQVSNVEKDWFRVSLMKITPPADRSAAVTIDELRQAMIEGIGTDYGLRSARWMSRFADGFRQAQRYRYQRVFLLGDAAHTHSPIGGQGLNLGIQDAINLGWKLAQVVRGESSDKLLDTFEEERYTVGTDVLEIAKAQTALIKPGAQQESLRAIIDGMLSIPEVVLQLSRRLSGLGIRYSWGDGQHPLVGQRIPDLQLTVGDDEKSLFSLMQSGRPLLLNFTTQQPISLPQAYQSRVDVINGIPASHSDSNDWQLPAVGSVPALKSLFVRPDGFVAWALAEEDAYHPDMLYAALQRWLD